MKFYDLNDPGNAERFRDYWGNSVRYLVEEKTWIRFRDHTWQREVSDSTALTECVAKSMYDELKVVDRDKLQDYQRHVIKSQSLNEQSRLLKYNRPKDFMGVSINEFDNQHTLINCRNCIVDLSTKQTIEHSPSQLHLHMANASYNPDAECPRWVKSFHTTFEDDEELKTFVRRIIGYSLTGLVREQYLFICHGQGADGKDFFLETIASVLGSYALTPDFSMFLLNKNKNDSRYLEAMGELKGIRFAVSVEPSKGVRFDNGTIKKLTGNNKLKGSVLGTKAYYFYPTHKILLVCNHLPHIDDLSRGMKRRIRIIPFPHAFDWTKNTNLKEVFLTEERDGIFRWCVDCAHEYLQYGLPEKMPKVVETATKEYFEANDTVGQFLREWIVEDVNKYVYKQDAYKRFVEINGQNAMSKREFIDAVETRPDFVKNERQAKGVAWNGFAIR